MNDQAQEALRSSSIAIIGMAARFPGADRVEQFWSNIAQGVESITFFSDEELLTAGVDPDLLARPDFVKASPVLDEVDLFDASFFKIGRREARMMDPQQRILLELAWETLERAGYAGDSYRGAIGVFAGAGGLMSSYLLSPFHVHRRLIGGTGSMPCIGNDKDYLATRLSYKLNLRGPSLTVQTACSTSLVSVHLACQSLLTGECDMALAGGVTIRVPHRMGYLAARQALLSPDGHCRAFDADAQGTLFGSGAGLVLLKLLPQAVEDGDHIHAVIRGSAVNNDGASKLSYWAASANGQAAAAASALAVAETDPRTIGYMEAHGTATSMGDPVEVFGLTRAFRRGTHDNQFCALGSVKTNVGHLEAAAGIAGLIKAALALEHKTLPPSLHFSKPNPRIDFASTPFYVNTECRPWPSDGGLRRAAVNSLGIGGTNAHMILEEAPPTAPAAPAAPDRPVHLLTLSAKTPQALRELVDSYECHLRAHPETCLADLCFTANVGRGHFRHRLAVQGDSSEQVLARLTDWSRDEKTPGLVEGDGETDKPKVLFLFAGEGSQYVNMGRELYETHPVFRKSLLRSDKILRDVLEQPLLSALYPQAGRDGLLNGVEYAHPALFAVQYALAQLWKSWGVEPAAVLGFGVGEYAAACTAGVFSLEDGLRLVASRARLMKSEGGDRGPGSPTMQPIPDEFVEACRRVQFRKPHTRMIPSVTAGPAGEEIAGAGYWCRQFCEPADLAASMAALDGQDFRIFLEIGPPFGKLRLAGRAMHDGPGLWLSSVRPQQSAWETMLGSLARLYAHGVSIDWQGFDGAWPRSRIVLPTYPFQRQSYWVAADEARQSPAEGDSVPASLRLLAEGKIEDLVEELKAAAGFSDEELQLLPKLLQALLQAGDKSALADVSADIDLP